MTALRDSEHVLVVADWSLDLDAVVDALADRAAVGDRDVRWSLLMPAWLHGLDWAGDPHVSHPCAEIALLTLRELALRAGLTVDLTLVGDHDPITAVGDVCAATAFDAILLCTRRRRLVTGHPLDLVHRMHTVSGVPVARVLLPSAGRGHCAPVADAA
jgi:nucleotide-binding universal stress UspA family protein